MEVIGREQNRFVILRRGGGGGGVPMIFKVPPDQEKAFKRIAPHVTNDQFGLAARNADPDGHSTIRGIPLGNHTAAIGIARSSYTSRGVKQEAYKITFLREVRN
ncbi:MAG: hypothetical protein LBC30_01250 [Puniceicoccales bacterium]|jgi:hypothetical protein|nr:hypothetical protein [Puniceicoccales bacterium]